MHVKESPNSSRFLAFISLLGALMVFVPVNGFAADPATFTDDFEGGSLSPFWIAAQQNGTVVFPYSGHAHSGANAVLFQASGDGQKDMSLHHAFETPKYGKVAVWVYDTMEYIYFSMGVKNSALETSENGLGVQDWDSSDYYYGVSDGVSGGKSSVSRSVGWHKFGIDSTTNAMILSVDDQVVYSGAGAKPFDLVTLRMSGPGYSGNIAYDDFSFEAAPEPVLDFTYTTNAGTINIERYIGSGGNVLIPSVINGLPVASIGMNAFYSCATLTNVTVPDSVKDIGNTAFEYCGSLTNVAIGSGVTNIGYHGFFSCASLMTISVNGSNPVYSSVDGILFNKDQTTLILCPAHRDGSYTIPGSVTTICAGAFDHCIRLADVIIPDSVTNIDSEAFYYCTSLANVTIGNNVTNIGNLAFYNCVSLTNVTIPDSVATVSGAFSDCSALASVTLGKSITNITGAFVRCSSLASAAIPASVTSIGDMAFAGCDSLTNVTIPNTITNIGDSAFSQCGKLKGLTMPDAIANIGRYAFDSCGSLTNVTIPGSVTTIGEYAFRFCSNLTEMTVPDSVTSIGWAAFYKCSSITNIMIGKGASDIAYWTFSGCTGLRAITVDALNSHFSSMDGVLFNKEETILIAYPQGKDGNYVIPNSVTSIGNYAFQDCAGLVNVTISGGITNIGSQAFCSCASLTGVFFKGDALSIDGSVFNNANSATIYYLPGTARWDTAFGGRPTALWNAKPVTGDKAFGVQTNGFGFNITGTVGIPIVVEACTNLASGIWVALQTNTLPETSLNFNDPQWTNYPGRFYRIRTP